MRNNNESKNNDQNIINNRQQEALKSGKINGTFPHQINSPNFEVDAEQEKPFVNEHGVTIGDSMYDSANSPLNNWSKDTHPFIMAGDDWVHPTNDIGWNSKENIDLVEKKIKPKGVPFMHPNKDVGYDKD